MITKAEKKRIKKVLGWRCAPLIKDYMERKGLLNTKEEPYSSQQITNTLNGVRHDVIEASIFELVALKKDELKKRKQILSA